MVPSFKKQNLMIIMNATLLYTSFPDMLVNWQEWWKDTTYDKLKHAYVCLLSREEFKLLQESMNILAYTETPFVNMHILGKCHKFFMWPKIMQSNLLISCIALVQEILKKIMFDFWYKIVPKLGRSSINS